MDMVKAVEQPSRKRNTRSSKQAPSHVESAMGGLGAFDIDDMILWHQFITSTALTFSRPWKSEIPVLAGSHDFLMHGILATAAMHMAYLHPEQYSQYFYKAASHQYLAVGPFRASMLAVGPDNCNAVFAFSTLLVILSLNSQNCEATVLSSTINQACRDLVTWIIFLRGCGSLFLSLKHYIELGPLSPLASFCLPTEVAIRSDDDRAFCRLSEDLLTDVLVLQASSKEELEAYRRSIYQLRLTAAAPWSGDSLTNLKTIMLAWPNRIPDLFIRLFDEHRPPAMIIMAYFCTLMKRFDGYWYMEGRADAVLNALRLELAPEWHKYLGYLLTRAKHDSRRLENFGDDYRN
ncbi:uncharacterized protein A1O9_13136, partial [Exophiala aquamarina CBS 119918]